MRGHIILLGTSHPLQCGVAPHTPSEVDNFRTYVREICSSHNIRLIAEEMSPDGLYEKKDTIACEVARDLDIQHIYIDLTKADRKNLSISDFCLASAAHHLGTAETKDILRDMLTQRVSNPIRECCWFARILAHNVRPTLFVCGADHIENMRGLISSVDQRVTVAHHDYAP